MRKYIFTAGLISLMSTAAFSQDLLGLGTGNYAGVTGMFTNPASIVDSRLKFDLNLIGVSNYYSNNYLYVKRDALIKGSFFKDKYKDWSLVQRDLLQEGKLGANERVHMRLNNRVMAPLSFMLTTGKKSAIALNISNRTGFTADNINQDFARLAYRKFEDASFYGSPMNMNGVDLNILNWLDVGFTYGRVLLNQDKHFVKAAFTAKYIGGIASGYYQADEMSLSFNDKNNVNARTPYARYGHGEKLSLDMFKSASLKSLRPEAEGFGWNAGIVYEYRGKIDRFKYLNPESEEKLRRDKNKYTFKVGFSIMDAGRLTFKKSELNNDFSANITDWNLKQYNIRSINDVDTMLSSRVVYQATGDNSYSVSLPTAYSAQFDLHIARGFYVNAMTYQPFSLFDTDKKMHVEAAYAVTPRFESRVLGLYFPVSYNKFDDWNIGATLRLGPVYVGSSNLGSLVFNDKTKTANIHAGLRIPITYGSPSRLAKTFSEATRSRDRDVYDPTAPRRNVLRPEPTERRYASVDSTVIKKEMEVKRLEARLFELEKQKVLDSIRLANKNATQSPVSITINNYTGAGQPTVKIDTIRTVSKIVEDSVSIREINKKRQEQIDDLTKRLAERELLLKELKEKEAADTDRVSEAADAPKDSGKKEEKENDSGEKVKEKSETTKKEAASTQPLARSISKADKRLMDELKRERKSSEDLEDEIRDLRKAILSYSAVSTAGSVGANAMISKRQARKMEAEMDRLRAEMAKYESLTTDASMDSNHLLRNEIDRLNQELRTQGDSINADSLNNIAKLEAEIGALQKDLQQLRNHPDRDVATASDQATSGTIAPSESITDRLLSLKLEHILFDVNEVEVRPIYHRTLNFVAKCLNDYPQLNLSIDGYTDKTGNAALNRMLSYQRAQAVQTYLIQHKVDGEQLHINGHGEQLPLVDNSTRYGQMLNRRVELRFFQNH
ncbi:DUF5723 family protein [Niabella insulamsoli]|uniref:DUF5723 family protein n=1 Tax=Niabella insulamsoli TaxID=3144874 RepID=UPI0031FCC6E3